MGSAIASKAMVEPAQNKPKWRISRLTLRILAVNFAALLVLLTGFIFLTRYQTQLIEADAEVISTESQIFAAMIGEGAVSEDENLNQILDIEMVRQMVSRLSHTSPNLRVQFFTPDGKLLVDSHLLEEFGPVRVDEEVLIETDADETIITKSISYLKGLIHKIMPSRDALRPLTTIEMASIDAAKALTGENATTVWENKSGEIILTAAAPVQHYRQIHGAVLLTRDGHEIDATLQMVFEGILKVFLGALAITFALSLYLSRTLTRPIRQLAHAAHKLSQSRGKSLYKEKNMIPDLSRRRDEIGDLSLSLVEMTKNLKKRMEATEHFAADVSHEIKNPLSSMRSAVETIGRIKDTEQQQKMMDIIEEDIIRLDILISDIADSSRLDAEFLREDARNVNIGVLLKAITDSLENFCDKGNNAKIILEAKNTPLIISGHDSRLAQLFQNLIENALSFSPKDGKVYIKAWQEKNWVMITIRDEGKGLPSGTYDKVFDRFYSERLEGKDCKNMHHSGLGLSIAKQITLAHNGRIFASNIDKNEGSGAIFTVQLPLL